MMFDFVEQGFAAYFRQVVLLSTNIKPYIKRVDVLYGCNNYGNQVTNTSVKFVIDTDYQYYGGDIIFAIDNFNYFEKGEKRYWWTDKLQKAGLNGEL